MFLLIILDMVTLRFRLRRELARRFPDESTKGTTYYAITRAMQMKFMRMPKSKVQDRRTTSRALPLTPPTERRPHRILVFSRTTGFRHASIEVGVETIRMLGEEHGFEVEHTERSRDLRAKPLRAFTAVCFLNTTGNVLGDRSRGRAA